MSTSIVQIEIELQLLERVLLRFGCADTDEKLEATIKKFLVPVLLKIETSNQAVKNKVIDVLTHLNIRLKSHSQVQLPVEELLTQYQLSNYGIQNFIIIYIMMGYPRITMEQQIKLVPKLFTCIEVEETPKSNQDKLLLLVLPLLVTMRIPDNPNSINRNSVLGLENKPNTKKKLIALFQDVLLLAYGVTPDATLPPGLSPYSFKRIISTNWKTEELEQMKKGIVRFICSGVFTDLEAFILLVLASSDTRFNVATPALAELNKVSTTLDFNDPKVTAPLYTLFSGNDTQDLERKTTPCSARVRQKLLQYLIRSRGKGINTVRGIQVIFEGLFGHNTNQKCKVLSLQFCENLIKDGQKAILSKVSGVILSGISNVINRDVTEPVDVQNAAYSAIAQLARTCPEVVNKDLKMVVSYFNNLSTANPALHSSIREALVSMAPAFAWNLNTMEVDGSNESANQSKYIPTSQQNLLLAMLTDNAESKLQIVQNVTSVFLTTCFPEHYAPARYLLLLIAGDRSSLRESITSYLYGVSKKDHINYIMLSSIDYPEDITDDFNKLSPEQRRVVLPSFKEMMNYVAEMNKKRLSSSIHQNVIGRTTLGYNLSALQEILDYLRICLWFSAGVKSAPGDDKNCTKLKKYILSNYSDGDENNEIYKYLQLVMTSVEARRDETNLLCVYDLLSAAPEILTKKQMHLLEPLAISLKDVSEVTRITVAQIYGILLAYGLNDDDFNKEIAEILSSLNHKSFENRHGCILVIGHAFSRKILSFEDNKELKDFSKWTVFIDSVKLLVQMLCEQQQILVSSSIKSLALIGKSTEIPQFEVKIRKPLTNEGDMQTEEENIIVPSKIIIFGLVCDVLKSTSIITVNLREDAAKCLGCLAIGDGKYFTLKTLQKILSFVKLSKDPALNIAISHAIVCTLNGYDVDIGPPDENFINRNCDDKHFDWFLNSVIKLIGDPNPHSRQACSIWLLAIVKNCAKRPSLLAKKEMLQFAFTELLSDDSEFVQDVASRGLGLVFSLSDQNSRNDLANSLLDQLIGDKKQVNQVNQETEIFPEGFLGKTPTGGNITTYKELCCLASDLNQPEMIYQFMQLANHNTTWNSKLDVAFGLKIISKDAKTKMKPYLGKIIPRLFRYKYEPTPNIQKSMISIWDSIVTDSKETVELYYWDILKEVSDNLTANEFRIRFACCVAVRDLLKRSNGLRLRSDENHKKLQKTTEESMEVGPEPELKELWVQLLRVMKDSHIAIRSAAEEAINTLVKRCVVAVSSNHGKCVASSILPVLLTVIMTWEPIISVPAIHKISTETISKLIESCGYLIAQHLSRLIPRLLRATGELETPKLSYFSTRLAAQGEVQEAVDSMRVKEIKLHYTMKAIAKCVSHINYRILDKMTPTILDLIKTTENFRTKIATIHFICLVSDTLGKKMTPLTEKYIEACFTGLKDKNIVVQKKFAGAIGHLIRSANEQLIKNLFNKLDELYSENPANKGIPLAIQSISKRHHELLKDYTENIIPLVFFAMHEEITEDNKTNVELWKELWLEISPGDAGIRMNLDSIIPKLEKSLNDDSWSIKLQSANAINTIASRLENNMNDEHCLHLLNLLLCAVQGKTNRYRNILLEALVNLCKSLKKDNEISELSVNAANKEFCNQYPIYITTAIKTLDDIVKEFKATRYQEVYEMLLYLLIMLELIEDNIELLNGSCFSRVFGYNKERKPENIYIKLRQTAWKTSVMTCQQYKYDLKDCKSFLKIQIKLLDALGRFLIKIFAEEINIEIIAGPNRDVVIEKICSRVLTSLIYVSDMPFQNTDLTIKSLDVFLILIKKIGGEHNIKHLEMVEKAFNDHLKHFEKDTAEDVKWRIKATKRYLKHFKSCL